MKTVLVNQIDIDSVEKARLELYDLITRIETNQIKPNHAIYSLVNITHQFIN